MLKDLLSCITLMKGVSCNLQTPCAGIILSISSAAANSIVRPFSEEPPLIHPGSAGDRCTRRYGDTVATETTLSKRVGAVIGRVGCPEAVCVCVCVCGHSGGASGPSVYLKSRLVRGDASVSH